MADETIIFLETFEAPFIGSRYWLKVYCHLFFHEHLGGYIFRNLELYRSLKHIFILSKRPSASVPNKVRVISAGKIRVAND